MVKKIFLAATLLAVIVSVGYPKSTVRIKDISYLKGIRKNQLKGYGLVIGLAGKGDSAQNPLTKATLKNFFDTIGVSVDDARMSTKNVAAVMITADIDGFLNEGDRVTVQVASIGDAKTLSGGVLLQTALKGADGNTYAVAQGSVIVPEGRNTVTTVGTIPQGAIAEKTVQSDFIENGAFTLVLSASDFKTANNIATAIRGLFADAPLAQNDAKSITVSIPSNFISNTVDFISKIQELEVEQDTTAKVIIDERSGVIVMGEDVRVASVGVSVAGIKIKIDAADAAAGGTPAQKKKANQTLADSATVKSVVDGLNELGVDVKDIIQVLIALKAAGALNAEIIVNP